MTPRDPLHPSRTNLDVIAIGKIEVQMSGLAEQSSARGASVAIDHLLLHRVLDKVALVLGVVALRQELRRLLRSAVRAVHLAQLHHRGQAASLALSSLRDRPRSSQTERTLTAPCLSRALRGLAATADVCASSSSQEAHRRGPLLVNVEKRRVGGYGDDHGMVQAMVDKLTTVDVLSNTVDGISRYLNLKLTVCYDVHAFSSVELFTNKITLNMIHELYNSVSWNINLYLS